MTFTQYNEAYAKSIERNAPFSFFAPLARRSKRIKTLLLYLITTKESAAAKLRAQWITKNLRPKTALDVGTADGKLVAELLKKNIDAHGIEPSEFQIQNLPEMLKERVVLGDAGNLPFKSEAFDVVTAYHVLEHIPEERLGSSIRELARVSRKTLIFELPPQECYNARVDLSHVSVFPYRVWLARLQEYLGTGWSLKTFKKPHYFRPLFMRWEKV